MENIFILSVLYKSLHLIVVWNILQLILWICLLPPDTSLSTQNAIVSVITSQSLLLRGSSAAIQIIRNEALLLLCVQSISFLLNCLFSPLTLVKIGKVVSCNWLTD